MDPLNEEPVNPETTKATTSDPSGKYDFDLAEFPIFKFYKNTLSEQNTKEPLVYTDTIKGNSNELVTRIWKVYPSRYGFGGASTMVLLYDILQLYVEQGARGRHIRFGTLRALFHRRGTTRNPSQDDYTRLERDLEILRGLDFHCENAFWDTERQGYVSMRWRLFDNVVFFKEKASSRQEEL